MILKGAPIIHARTFHVDFRSKLLIRPTFFSEVDAEYCYKVVTDSTIFREFSPKEGRVVFYAKGNYIIVGKTAVFSDLFDACCLEPKYERVDSRRGRVAYGFVGAAFKRNDVTVPFVIGDEELLRIYVSQIAHRWDEEYGQDDVLNSRFSDMIDINVEIINGNDKFVPLLRKRTKKIIIDDTSENRNGILTAVYKIAKTGQDIALCTSLQTEKAIRESCFDVVTCENASTIVLNNPDGKVPEKAVVHEKLDSVKETTSHDEFLEKYSVPQDDEAEIYRIRSLIGRSPEKFHSKAVASEDLIRVSTSKRKAKSFDDVLEQSVVPSEDGDREGRFRTTNFPASGMERWKKEKVESENKNFPENLKDIGLVLGTIAGVVFIVVEVASESNPIVLALTGMCTVVFAGLEAKNIIDKFRN